MRAGREIIFSLVQDNLFKQDEVRVIPDPTNADYQIEVLVYRQETSFEEAERKGKFA
jgi:hypothetical protein